MTALLIAVAIGGVCYIAGTCVWWHGWGVGFREGSKRMDENSVISLLNQEV